MIHEEVCTYEVAKLAKEKGFPQEVFGTCEMKSACYVEDGRFYKDGCICPIEDAYTAPTQSLLQRWLREEKGVVIEIPVMPTTRTNEMYEYKFYIFWNSDGHYMDAEYDDRIYTQYEHALEDALKYALENLV